MEEISRFIVDYWPYISFGFLVIVDIIILIVKKVRLSFKYPDSSINFIIEKISDAERIYGEGHGKEKLNYVVESYIKQFNVAKYFETSVRYYVENKVVEILNTPTRKGGQGREETTERKE